MFTQDKYKFRGIVDGEPVVMTVSLDPLPPSISDQLIDQAERWLQLVPRMSGRGSSWAKSDPRPEEYDDGSSTLFCTIGEGEEDGRMHHEDCLATVHSYNISDEEFHTNALLISRIPELLDLISEMADELRKVR